jgi:hypothetical protein
LIKKKIKRKHKKMRTSEVEMGRRMDFYSPELDEKQQEHTGVELKAREGSELQRKMRYKRKQIEKRTTSKN